MGKRSNFDRIERDFYPTPESAVLPLLPFLKPNSSFHEPCAGDGQLVRILESHGHKPNIVSDIEPRNDTFRQMQIANALDVNVWAMSADYIITNPPWDRKILHPMIEHFSNFKPTWLLFDSDWAYTKQAKQFKNRCRKIVSVGRVKWFPESKMSGKDNCAWYLFDKPSDEETSFHF